MATDVRFRPPESKKECQALLREHGHTGLKIHSIEDDRVFALTAPQYHRDGPQDKGRWLRQARTVVFDQLEDGTLRSFLFEGWIV